MSHRLDHPLLIRTQTSALSYPPPTFRTFCLKPPMLKWINFRQKGAIRVETDTPQAKATIMTTAKYILTEDLFINTIRP